MVRFRNPQTNETRSFGFRWWMLITPAFALHLLLQGAIIAGILSILPLFAIINFIFYGSIMRRRYRRKGWIEVNDFGQAIGPVAQAQQAG